MASRTHHALLLLVLAAAAVDAYMLSNPVLPGQYLHRKQLSLTGLNRSLGSNIIRKHTATVGRIAQATAPVSVPCSELPTTISFGCIASYL